jgi:hypothetical protein
MKTEDYLNTVKQEEFLDIASMSMSDVKMHRWETKYELGGQPASNVHLLRRLGW